MMEVWNLKKLLSLYALVGGLAIALLAAGADLIGFASLLGENGAWRNHFFLLGLVIAAIGVTTDFAFGERLLFAWLRPIVRDWQGLAKFASLIAQLGLLTVIMRLCYLEHHAFYHQVMSLTFYGFIIHHLLPRAWRLHFFILLSLAGLLSVFGFADSAWLLGISLVLIGICHAPIPFWARVTILLAAGGFLTAARFGYVAVPWTKAIWPILASMFMFRFIIYLYDFKHHKAPVGLVNTLSYFFLLPNVAFPLFPVVDYSAFRRTYYNEDEYRIYQTGIKWMLWGVLHLLLYRYINYYWVIGPEKVHSTYTLVQYMVSNYLLILRLTGQFHLVVGILHLFGFNLPRIMDVFLLSTGFTDYWRRVNVYWKDFIQKVFYYPAYFRMRKVGNTAKLVVATLLGFLVTWFFHAYQWFWIRGAFMLSLPDILFWLCMGLLVLTNSLYEAQYGRKRALVKGAATLREIASKTLRATGVFVVISLLWSLWISPSVSEWFDLLKSAEVTLPELAITLLVVIAGLGSAMLVYEKSLQPSAANPHGGAPAFFRFAAPTAAAILILYFLAQPTYAFRLGASASDLIADLKTDRLNERDAALLERGYYENLTNVSTFNSQLWELYMQKPDDWIPLEETSAVRQTHDFRKYELVPLLNGTVKHAPFITNRWGMRDDDYEQMPPANTYRIAMIGASVAQGSGVLHEESFEYLVEKRLNQEPRGGKYAKYEILNFAVGGYNILQQLAALENKVFDFKPDMLFCMSHTRDEDRLFKFLLETPFQAIPYEGVRQIMRTAGVTADMKTNRAAKLLEPYNGEIMSWAYQRIVENCRARGVVPVWICLPSEPGLKDTKRAASLAAVAAEAGFIVLNLIDAYDSAPGAYLQVTPWDKHPNAKGHRLIANRIYAALLENQDKIPLGFSGAAKLSASKAE
ncbi:MAG: hypothetical protein ALAOOOJD_01373 [bacterium]|nr:hypothetical protein [bacterium]